MALPTNYWIIFYASVNGLAGSQYSPLTFKQSKHILNASRKSLKADWLLSNEYSSYFVVAVYQTMDIFLL
jgi:hypothetical protein